MTTDTINISTIAVRGNETIQAGPFTVDIYRVENPPSPLNATEDQAPLVYMQGDQLHYEATRGEDLEGPLDCMTARFQRQHETPICEALGLPRRCDWKQNPELWAFWTWLLRIHEGDEAKALHSFFDGYLGRLKPCYKHKFATADINGSRPVWAKYFKALAALWNLQGCNAIVDWVKDDLDQDTTLALLVSTGQYAVEHYGETEYVPGWMKHQLYEFSAWCRGDVFQFQIMDTDGEELELSGYFYGTSCILSAIEADITDLVTANKVFYQHCIADTRQQFFNVRKYQRQHCGHFQYAHIRDRISHHLQDLVTAWRQQKAVKATLDIEIIA